MFTRAFRCLSAFPIMVCVALGGGCITHYDNTVAIRAALDCPKQFAAKGSGTTLSPDMARSPMVDPNDGTEIILVRSDRGWGDYQVPAGRYGVKPGELLRLETATGRVIGVVRK